MVKPDVATGRDNVPGSILCFLPEITQTRLYYAVVERLAGRENAHIKDWAEFDVCLVPKKRRHFVHRPMATHLPGSYPIQIV